MNTVQTFINYIRKRIARNKDFKCIITGESGSGKTYSALSIAELIDKNFSEKNIALSSKQFFDLADSLEKDSVIVFDEVGVSYSAKEYQSRINKYLSYVTQTMRSKGLIVLMTTPSIAFLDKSGRTMCQCHLQTEKILRERSICILKPLMMEINQHDGEVWKRFMRYKSQGRPRVLKHLEVPLPSFLLRKRYEEMKLTFQKELTQRIRAELGVDTQTKLVTEPEQIGEKPLERIDQLILEKVHEGKSVSQIASELKPFSAISIGMRIKKLFNKGLLST